MGGREKFTLDFVKKTFEERGCELLETEYKNDRTPLRYIARCGHERTSTFNNFQRGKGDLCRACRYKTNGDKRRLSQSDIREAFESEGCKVLSVDGEGEFARVRYIALCGHENVCNFNKFTSANAGRVCSVCSRSVRYKYDFVKESFEERDCVLLETEYKNCKTKMRYIAQCGHESTITFDALLNSTGAALRCRQCHKHTYHEVPIDRNKTASKTWRKAVYARDNYTCVACGKHGGDLNAHHLAAYDNAPDFRFSVDNGVTLCPACHIRFHAEYGFGGNTPEQFREWIEGNTEVIARTKELATP